MSSTSPAPVSSTRPILGPLTTTASFPQYCSTNFAPFALAGYNFTNTAYFTSLDRGVSCSDGRAPDATSCWHVSGVGQSNTVDWDAFYSPGLICPSGLTSACTGALNTDGSPSTIAANGTSYVFPSMIPGETAVGCCPRYGYARAQKNL